MPLFEPAPDAASRRSPRAHPTPEPRARPASASLAGFHLATSGAAPAGGVGRAGYFTPAAAPLQRKPVGDASGDADEREADAVAEAMLRPGSPAAPRAAAAGPGGALPDDVRAYFEPRLGRDLGGVRLHTGADAARAARAVDARAYTVGRDIVFGAGEFAPGNAAGRRLLAHELVHVAQQTAPPALAGAAAPSVTPGPTRMRRTPGHGTADLHDELIEQFRAANGLPPRGIDPGTGQQVGPTNSEIRFGGLLEQWLARSAGTPAATPSTPVAPTPPPPATPVPRSVPAPAHAPAVVGRGTTDVTVTCGRGAAAGECLTHQNYVRNILPQAVANIRAVASPYSAAIADMYGAALPATLTAPAPPTGGRSSNAAGGPVTVTFAGTTHTFTSFTISLQQWPGGANGQAFGIGGPVAFVNLNEASNDALLGNLPGIEETMVHEAIHLLSDVVAATNRGRPPGAAAANPNLDEASYATERAQLVAAVRPFVDQIRALPSFTGQPSQLSAASDTDLTAGSFLSESIARAEAGIYAKQRAGQAFTAADLRTLPPFFRADAYWSPTPPTRAELVTFLASNQAAIDAAIQPLVYAVGERYLSLRP